MRVAPRIITIVSHIDLLHIRIIMDLYTAFHINVLNVPEKGWRQRVVAKKAFANRNVFFVTITVIQSRRTQYQGQVAERCDEP